jgi:hypothetical protein
VFIAHTTENKSDAKYLYDYLHKLDVAPWLDSEKIKGQNWNKEILKALNESDVILLCLSKKSVNKRGELPPTFKNALDYARKEPEGSVVIIPVRLESCEIPKILKGYQTIDLFAENGIERLLASLNICAQQIMAKSILLEGLPAFELRRRKYDSREQPEFETSETITYEKTVSETTEKAEGERIAREKIEVEEKVKEDHLTQVIQPWYDRAVSASKGTLEERLSSLQIFRYLGDLSKEKPFADMPDYVLTLRTDDARQAAVELVDDLRTKCIAPIEKAFNAGANLGEEDLSYLANLARILREGNLIYSDLEKNLAAWAEIEWAKHTTDRRIKNGGSSSDLDAIVSIWVELDSLPYMNRCL